MGYTKAQYIEKYGEEAYKEYLKRHRASSKKYCDNHREEIRKRNLDNYYNQHDYYLAQKTKYNRSHPEIYNNTKRALQRRKATDDTYSFFECLRSKITIDKQKEIIADTDEVWIEYTEKMLQKEAEDCYDTDLLDFETMYSRFKSNIENHFEFANYIILKYFAIMMRIKVIKDEEYTDREREMMDYYKTSTYNNKATVSVLSYKNKFFIAPGYFSLQYELHKEKLKKIQETWDIIMRARGLRKE